jgi:hypothetical protein
MENITLRKRLPKSKSDHDLFSMSQDVLNSTIIDASMLSFHSEVHNSELSYTTENFIQEIANLKSHLESAEKEIDNLNLENNDLKRTIINQNKQIETLKTITSDIGRKNNRLNTPIRSNLTVLHGSLSKQSPLNFDKSVLFNSASRLKLQHYKPRRTLNYENVEKSNRNIYLKPTSPNVLLSNDNTLMNNTTNNNSNTSTKSRIFILGDEQISGLSKKIQNRQKPTLCDSYTVTTMVKKNAICSQILNSCDDLEKTMKKDDIVILAIGKNDKNPYQLFSELGTALFKLKKFKVFIVNVLYNSNLNINLLNYNIQTLVRNYNNCKFIKLSNNYNMHLNELSYRINIEIDYIQYQKEFLAPQKIRAFLSKNSTYKKHKRTIKLKQKTILHYFTKIDSNNLSDKHQQNNTEAGVNQLFRHD